MKKRHVFRSIDLGVRFELILKIFIVALFSSLLMGSLVYKFFESSLVHREKVQLRSILTYVSLHKNIYDFELDLPTMYGLKAFLFLDDHFRTLSGKGHIPEDMKRNIPSLRVIKKGLFLPSYQEIQAVFIIGKERDKIKFLYICKGLEELNEELFNIRKTILYIVLLTTVVTIFFLNYLLQTTITAPINNIINDIKEIENDRKNLLEGGYLKEFNYLIENFNNLIKLTNYQKKELEGKLREVQYLNNLLTRYHDEMSRFEKLVSIGELSAGVAHEIGNPLNNIVGYLALSREKVASYNDGELADYLERIESEVSRINGIVRGMLEFSRKEGNIRLEVTDLKKEIEKTVSLAQLMIKGKEIAVNCSFPEEPVNVDMDPNRFQQVLLNILSNAIDSIEHAGKIGIRVDRAVELDLLEKSFMDANRVDAYARVTVEDDGAGIDKGDLRHVFDPFFTTKEPGRGTGLGLSVSLRLIEEMGGILRIDSEKGRGTIVTIVLPVHR